MSNSDIAFEGSIPGHYDQYLGPLLFEPYAVDLASRVPKSGIAAVLELACGTGRVTNHLRKQIPPGASLVASDLNSDMISVARSKVPHPGIEWHTADMLALPFGDQEFDAVVCQFGIMFVPDKVQALREVLRVLRPGGQFLFSTWDRIENNGVSHIANQVIRRFLDNKPPHFYSIPYSMYKPDELRNLPFQSGFSSVDVRLVKKVGRSSTAMDAARGIVEGNPVINEIKGKDPAAVVPIVEEISKEIAIAYNDKPVISPLQAWVCEAIK